MPKQNLKNDKPIVTGLIGLGYFGKNYLRLLQDIKDVNLRTVANRESEAFETHKNLLKGIKTTLNSEDIFSDQQIDAIFIVTPPATHYELIEKGLASGKHIFVEKPMVLSISEAKRLKTLVEKGGKVFMVGFQYLFNENVRFLKKEIDAGTFGKIISFKSEHILSPLRQDVGVFEDAAPHPLSVFQYLFNPNKLISVEGEIERDFASVKIQFENAPALEIKTFSFGEKKVRKIILETQSGQALIDETLEKDKLAITKNGKTIYPTIVSEEPLRNEVEHFFQCIKTKGTPLSDVNFGLRITEWLETILKLANQNQQQNKI